MENFIIIVIILQLTTFSIQLTEYEACQKLFNCTKILTQKDCPLEQFLDTKMTNDCCHGCRGGIGNANKIKLFQNL